MPITALPTPPSRQDPANFAVRGDALLSALPTFVTEANALQSDVNAKQGVVADDRLQTGQDRTATGQDRTQTGQDRSATESDRALALTYRDAAVASADTASAASNSALAIYGTTNAMNTALQTAAAQNSLAQTAAASASSVLAQDLSAISAALHRSPNAVTAMCVMDLSKDSDGGAWADKCHHTSWYNEPLNGAWRGAVASEAACRAISGAATGDYYQNSTDGKFYKLNAASGTTEVFRGNKAKPGRLMVAVAEAGNVTVYDITEKGCPMWLRFVFGGAATNEYFLGSGSGALVIKALAYVSGQIFVGEYGAQPYVSGLRIADFAGDKMRQWNNSSNYTSLFGVGRRNFGVGFYSDNNPNGTPLGINNAQVNAIATTVLPNAPVDPVTKLQIPTVVVVTGGAYGTANQGVAILKHDGTVAVSAASPDYFSYDDVWLDGNNLFVTRTGYLHALYAKTPGSLGNGFVLTNLEPVVPFNGSLGRTRGISRSNSLWFTGAKIRKIQHHETALGRSSVSVITDTYSTGHLVGNTVRAYLANTEVESVSNPATISDRSYKGATATIYGALTKTPVATGAQLVAYSGFSAVNYIQEPYSADLDFPGEMTVGAPVNVPVVMAASSFPVIGAELTTNGTFDVDTGWMKGVGATITGGVLTLGAAAYAYVRQNAATAFGRSYRVTFTVSNYVSGSARAVIGDSGPGASVAANGTYGGIINCTDSVGYIGIYSLDSGLVADIDNFSIREVGPSILADRSASAGPSFKLGIDPAGKLTASLYDGTTTRTVTTDAAYNTGTSLKASAHYVAGKLSIDVNGKEVKAVTGAPLLTLANPNAVLTIGNSRTLDAPWPGSITLLKIGATVPTPEQSSWTYEQEKMMFREGAQITLPAATAVVDLTYDESQDKWVAVQAGFESSFTGLIRTASAAVSAGSFIKTEAKGGVKLLARSTTSPGVDIVVPAYGLREELVRRGEAAARASRPVLAANFDAIGFTATTAVGSNQLTVVASVVGTPYIGMGITGTGIPSGTTVIGISGATYTISANATAAGTAVAMGQCDFTLDPGMTAVEVIAARQSQREGATKDYVRLFDGFRETVRFAVSPGSAAWVQILQRKEAV